MQTLAEMASTSAAVMYLQRGRASMRASRPVSYTHLFVRFSIAANGAQLFGYTMSASLKASAMLFVLLKDVYKRQARTSRGPSVASTASLCMGLSFANSVSMSPVSYTHLDVYKRQAAGLAAIIYAEKSLKEVRT